MDIPLPHEGEAPQWHALRVTYGRGQKARDYLETKGIRTFLPMKTVRYERDGKVVRQTIPAVSNLVFAKACQQDLYDCIRAEGEQSMTRFIWDRVTRKPLVVPDAQMDAFIRVCEVSADDAVFLSELDDKLRSGTRVKVVFGPLAGVEGRVVRIRKSRRILIEIPEVMAVASTYVPLEYLEILPEESEPAQ